MGVAEVKGKRVVDLKMGSIMRDKVQDKYTQYWSFFRGPKETTTKAAVEKVPTVVDTFYNLVAEGRSLDLCCTVTRASLPHRDEPSAAQRSAALDQAPQRCPSLCGGKEVLDELQRKSLNVTKAQKTVPLEIDDQAAAKAQRSKRTKKPNAKYVGGPWVN
eukprot:XP_020404701.1 uncharacterized protein LOC109944372 [Zea mays]